MSIVAVVATGVLNFRVSVFIEVLTLTARLLPVLVACAEAVNEATTKHRQINAFIWALFPLENKTSHLFHTVEDKLSRFRDNLITKEDRRVILQYFYLKKNCLCLYFLNAF